MDMTSLSSTLPGNNQNSSSSRRPQNSSKQHSPDIADESQNIIEAFQSAARSVTHLYRSSAALIRSSRTDGYTDALSDVLEAIDNESAYNDPSLALSRIRDWVIDRRHEIKGGVAAGNAAGRSDSMPPRQQREMSAESEMDDGTNNNSGKDEEQQRREETRQDVPYPDLQQQDLEQPQMNVQSIPQFSFQPLHPLPQYPSQTPDVIEPLQSPGVDGIFMFNSPAMTQQMPNGRSSSSGNKVPLAPRSNNAGLGGAGTKRRNQSVDFFDLGGFGNFGMNGTPGRDFGNWGGGGGGQGNAKRGKFV
ncbi:hypothetical protein TWF718_000105 [Orbilia javanica]|uniref:Uncharacterized protein n=1 Tax=Orbilia javanica TaxID=47235 RepID=A0AAN8N722_9PEZI